MSRSVFAHDVPALILLIGLVLGSASAAQPAELPADLDLVPRDALGFVHVRAADLWRSDLAREFRVLVDTAGPDAWKAFEKKSPINPAIVERVTFIFLTPQTLREPFPAADPEAMSALVLVTTKKPFDPFPLIQALASREKVYRQHLYYFNEETWSGLVVVDDRTFLLGSEDALVRYFEMSRRKTQTGPLQQALEKAAGKHQIVVGINPRMLARADGWNVPEPIQTALTATSGMLTLDVDDGVRLNARLEFTGEKQAQEGEPAARQLLELVRTEVLARPMAELQKLLGAGKTANTELPRNFAALVSLGLLREIDTLLKEAPVARHGSALELSLTYKRFTAASLMGLEVLLRDRKTDRFYSEANSSKYYGKRSRDPVETHLRTLAAAINKYREQHGTYPPAAIYDKDGRAILSWRVLLLPYLGEDSLYREFKLEEPWDSLHNKALLKKMPKALQVGVSDTSSNSSTRPSAQDPDRWKTMTHVLSGENTVFEGSRGVLQSEVSRPVVLLVRLSNHPGTYWTKPGDIAYANDRPLPDLFAYGTRIRVLLTDGSYGSVERTMEEKSLRALIERGGIRPPRSEVPADGDLQALWQQFGQNDDAGARNAWQGVLAMSKSPDRAIDFLKERVKPAPVPDAQQVAQSLIDLDSNHYPKRVKAFTQLQSWGELAQAAIDKKQAEKTQSLEARLRLEALARQAKTILSPEDLRGLRAVAVLEQAATPAARALLGELARGGEGAVLTEQARRALARLSK
jgi:hypothetical protein